MRAITCELEWKQGDGLRYQENIRNEWDRCP